MIIRKILDSNQVNFIDFMEYLRTPVCRKFQGNNSSLKFEWMNSKEAADYLRISVATLRNLTSAGEIPYCKLGRRNRYERENLKALLAKNKRGPL